MDIEFDPLKSQKNAVERGLPFELVRGFAFDGALTRVDDRFDYPETRYQSIGCIEDRVHVVVFALTPTGIRVISFRKANEREVKYYEQETQSRNDRC